MITQKTKAVSIGKLPQSIHRERKEPLKHLKYTNIEFANRDDETANQFFWVISSAINNRTPLPFVLSMNGA